MSLGVKFEHQCRYCGFTCQSKDHEMPVVLKEHYKEYHVVEIKREIRQFNNKRDKLREDPYIGELIELMK